MKEFSDIIKNDIKDIKVIFSITKFEMTIVTILSYYYSLTIDTNVFHNISVHFV